MKRWHLVGLVALSLSSIPACAGDAEVAADDDAGDSGAIETGGTVDSTVSGADAEDATPEAAPDTAPDTSVTTDGDATVDADATTDGDAAPDVIGDVAEAAVDVSDATDAPADADAGVTAPELWAVRVGSGTVALDDSAAQVTIDRLRVSDGAVLGSIALPAADATGVHALTLAGATPYQGFLQTTADGKYAMLVGFDAAPGTAAVTWGTAPRTVGRISATGAVDTTTITSFSGHEVRSVASKDGSSFWVGGSNFAPKGLQYFSSFAGASAGVGIDLTAVRQIVLFQDALYGTSSGTPRMFDFGGAAPTTATTSATMAGTDPEIVPDGLVMMARGGTTVDTLYVCTDDAGIQRWTKSGASWSLSASFPIADPTMDSSTTAGCVGLAATVVSGKVLLVAVTLEDVNRIVTFLDDGSTGATPKVVAASATNYAYRGVSFAPHP